jgi:hypothetical protein
LHAWVRRGMQVGFRWERGRPGVAGNIILNWILEAQDRVIWTGLIWLKLGARGRLLSAR